MAVERRRLLGDRVDVAVPVHVRHPAPLAAREAQRKRRVVEDRARVAARHAAPRRLEGGRTLRVGGNIALLGFAKGGGEVEVRLRRVHGPSPAAGRSEERRGGKECVSTGRSRWWRY